MLIFPKTMKEPIIPKRWCLVYPNNPKCSPSGFMIAQHDGRFWTDEKGLIIEYAIKRWAYLEPEKK